jgi:hypothetical protein
MAPVITNLLLLVLRNHSDREARKSAYSICLGTVCFEKYSNPKASKQRIDLSKQIEVRQVKALVWVLFYALLMALARYKTCQRVSNHIAYTLCFESPGDHQCCLSGQLITPLSLHCKSNLNCAVRRTPAN